MEKYSDSMIKQKMWNKNISSFLKVGFGKTSLGGTNLFGGKIKHREGKFLYTQYGMLFEANKNHLEIRYGYRTLCQWILGK